MIQSNPVNTPEEVLNALKDPSTQGLRVDFGPRFKECTSDQCTQIAEALKKSNVTEMAISGRDLTDEILVPFFAALSESPLNSLTIEYGTPCSEKMLEALANALPKSLIADLKVHAKRALHPRGWDPLLKALPHTKLKNLTFSHPQWDGFAAHILKETLPQTHLESLTIFDKAPLNAQSSYGVPFHLFADALPKSLQTLYLNGCEVNHEAAQKLADHLTGQTLKTLRLHNVGLTGYKAGCVLSALPNSELETLHLSGNAENDTIANILAGVLPKSALKELAFGGMKCSANGLSALFNALPRSTLERFFLQETALDNDMLAKLVSHLPESSLADLFFVFAGNDLVPFLDVLPMTKLRQLHFSYMPDVAPNGLEALPYVLPHTSITHLELRQHVNEAFFCALNNALPHSQCRQLILDSQAIETPGFDPLELGMAALDIVEKNNAITKNLALKLLQKPLHFTAEEWLEISKRPQAIEEVLQESDQMDGKHIALPEAQAALDRALEYAQQQGFCCDSFYMHTLPLEQMIEKISDESIVQAMLGKLPLPKAIEALKQRDMTLTAADFLNSDGTIPNEGRVCIGGAKALFAQPDLWESAAQIRKAFRSLPEAERDSIPNIQTLTAKISRRSHSSELSQ